MLAGLALAPDTDTTHSRPGDVVADRLVQTLPTAFRILKLPPKHSVTKLVIPSDSTLSFTRNDISESVTNLVTQSDHPAATAHRATPLAFSVPAGFPQVALPADNPLTVEGVELIRRLFHDPRLSGDGTQSCADCHAPDHGFSDPRPLSLGIAGLPGTRHSMPLFNLAWSPRYAWDGAQPRISDQALAAMRNPLEMHADPEKVAALLAADPALGSRIRSVTMMGGAVGVPGNITWPPGVGNQYAEWNFYVDPHAANIVFRSGLPVTLVALDATNSVPLNLSVAARLGASPSAALVRRLIESLLPSTTLYFWDPLAAALLVEPAIGTYAQRQLAVVEGEGPESGRVVESADGGRISLVTAASRARFESSFASTLR